MGSGGLTFKNETTLHYQAKSISIFIQTDKAMYKPGQTGNLKLYLLKKNTLINSSIST
jgi:CD109 antigen